MPTEKETEDQIFDAARKVFEQNGYAATRMQEIADEADINKSMLHYYYRSKDKLFTAVFREGMNQFLPVIYDVLNSDKKLPEKIEDLVTAYHQMVEKNPHLPSFVIFEMNQQPERFKEFIRSHEFNIPPKFFEQVEHAITCGVIKPIDPMQFLINSIALSVFPFIARNMIQTVFDMDDERFGNFLEDRKEQLPEFIMNAVT